MARFSVPSEAGLEALLREAFEFMPGPDRVRLREIEARLLRAAQRPAARHTTMPWWAILLLAGGTAAAAWWAGEYLEHQNRSQAEPAVVPGAVDSPLPALNAERRAESVPGKTLPEVEPPAQRPDARVIDRREEP